MSQTLLNLKMPANAEKGILNSLFLQHQMFMGKSPLPRGKVTSLPWVKLLCDNHIGWVRLNWSHRTHLGHCIWVSSSLLPGMLSDSAQPQGTQWDNCCCVKTASWRFSAESTVTVYISQWQAWQRNHQENTSMHLVGCHKTLHWKDRVINHFTLRNL